MILALPVRGLEYEAGPVCVYRLPITDAVSLHNWCLVQGHVVRLRTTDNDDLRVIVIKTPGRRR